MNYFFKDITGLIHLIASVLALLFGTMVLVRTKGTKWHKKIGYCYLMSMTVLLITSFMIYRMFKGFGMFHYAALFTAINLILGMVPIWLKKPKNDWRMFHLNFMYWSVIGLYMALAAELATRIPKTPFFGMVYGASGAVLFFGFILYFIKLKHWKQLSGVTKT
ncbi:MAG: hypothetical protein WBG90_12490 [Saonia sp.]